MRLIDAEALEEEFNWIENVTNESSIVDKEKHKTLMEDIERIQNAPTVDAIPISIIEDIKAEIKSICENTIYPPDDTFFREVVDEDYFFGLEYAIKIIDKHTSGKE